MLATLQNHWGARSLLLTDSGTSALALALRLAAQLRPGPVALPAWSCYDLATAADMARSEVILYDLDPETLGPDLVSLERVFARGATAVVVVHPYGLPLDLHPIRLLSEPAGALIIEDAAQAVGARVAGGPAGGNGALGVLSFGRGKGMTGGTGGALLLNVSAPDELQLPAESSLDPASGAFAAILKLTAQWILGRPRFYAIPSALPFLKLGQTIYHPAGAAARMPRAAEAVLSVTWSLQKAEVERRRKNAAILAGAVRGGEVGQIPRTMEGDASWLRFPIVATESLRARADVPEARKLGIAPGYPQLLVDLPGFPARVRNRTDNFPGARLLATRLITLPTHSLMTQRDLQALVRWLGAS